MPAAALASVGLTSAGFHGTHLVAAKEAEEEAAVSEDTPMDTRY